MSKLQLPDVTLVSITTSCLALTNMAISDCLRQADFGDVLEFKRGDDRVQFACHTLPYNIRTSHILFIHWDSWIIDPGMWSDEFLKYDYIGAPWWHTDGFNVGNSGFSMRSRALMLYMADNRERYPIKEPEDVTLCRVYRPRLPQFKWAPEIVAQDFAFERTRPSIESRHFGFHGMFNWPFVLPPDRLAERMELARRSAYIQQSGMLNEIDAICQARWLKIVSGVHQSVPEAMCDAAE